LTKAEKKGGGRSHGVEEPRFEKKAIREKARTSDRREQTFEGVWRGGELRAPFQKKNAEGSGQCKGEKAQEDQILSA